MKFTLIELLTLMVPMAFLALLISDLSRPRNLDWQEFSLSDFGRARANEIPAIVLSMPDMFAGSEWGKIDEQALLHRNSTQFVAFRHNFRYWTSTKSYDDKSREDQWVLDNGSYKEPLLTMISSDGQLKNIKGLDFNYPEATQEIVDHLGLLKTRQPRTVTLICLLTLSLITAVSLVGYRRHKLANVG